jgi:hypothetical protein
MQPQPNVSVEGRKWQPVKKGEGLWSARVNKTCSTVLCAGRRTPTPR